jgi:hypothetical protein
MMFSSLNGQLRMAAVFGMFVGIVLVAGGCSGRPTLFGNPDPALRKTSTELAADAAKRFPYRGDAPRMQETRARAQVGYSLNRVEVVNFSNEDWQDVEVWVNGTYVCYVPKMESRKLKEIHFPMLFNERGQSFPMDNKQVRVEKVEIFRAGRLHEVVCHNADF